MSTKRDRDAGLAPPMRGDVGYVEPAQEYLVVWAINLSAESPEEAARLALEIQRDPDSLALCFEVDGREIDLTP